jgi:hypothetical protein
MAKTRKTKTARKAAAATAGEPATLPEDQIIASNLSLHDLFQQQTARMLDRADLSDEEKQSLMIGMSCPCCGAGGFSFTAKLRREK